MLLRRRPPRGLLGGMLELPGTEWRPDPWAREQALAWAPAAADWRLAGSAMHGFTHFELRVDVYAAQVAAISPGDGLLRHADLLASEALPTAMRRCIQVVQAAPEPTPQG